MVESPDNTKIYLVMEAASVKARPTFIVTTKLVLDLMFKRIF